MKITGKHPAIVFCLVVAGFNFNARVAYLSAQPDYIFFNGRILTVDTLFSVVQALAVDGDHFIATGKDEEIVKLAGTGTVCIDLEGKTVMPGIIEAHLHPEDASRSELFDSIPDVHSICGLLHWIESQTRQKPAGEWIVHPKLFPTRLHEMRQPSLEELDSVAPQHPVFLNGSYGGMINSAAIRISGLEDKSEHPGLLKDDRTGTLTGYIRASAFGLLALPHATELTYEEQLDALESMISRYNEVGITSLCSGAGGPESLRMYNDLKEQGRLTARVFQNFIIPFDLHSAEEEILRELESWGFCTGFGDEWVRVGALKTIMDGGILTGTAFLREAWGDRAGDIYGISDPAYRGVLRYTTEDLIPVISAANNLGWKFTAHCTGGGAVDTLLAAYEKANESRPIRERRFSIIHGNFFTPGAMKKMAGLGVYADMQPAWFYKDADAMNRILGRDRIRTFHPYRSLMQAGVTVNGGSDHMVKFDSRTSINPYDPFLGMWTVITRMTERGSVYKTREALTREQAIRMYTINNAYASFEENIKGSIEKGKLADLIVLSEDILACPVQHVKEMRVLLTMVGGKIVYNALPGPKVDSITGIAER